MVDLQRRWKRLVKEIDKSIAMSIKEHEKEIKPEIISATPLRDGALRSSYKFEETSESKSMPGMIQYRIKFGSGKTVDPDTGQNYAAAIHEWPDLKTPGWEIDKGPKRDSPTWTTPRTGPKFLQTPVFRTANKLPKQLKKQWKKLEARFPGGKNDN